MPRYFSAKSFHFRLQGKMDACNPIPNYLPAASTAQERKRPMPAGECTLRALREKARHRSKTLYTSSAFLACACEGTPAT